MHRLMKKKNMIHEIKLQQFPNFFFNTPQSSFGPFTTSALKLRNKLAKYYKKQNISNQDFY